MQLPRWYYLLRYHRLRQFVERGRSVVRRKLRARLGAKGYDASHEVETRQASAIAFQTILEHKLTERRQRGAQERAAQLQQREFCFLNQPVDFSDGIDWRLETHPQLDALWRFHLHYHEFLLDLVAAAKANDAAADEFYGLAWEIVADWITANPTSNRRVFGDAWHPFCISRRLPVWTLLLSATEPPAGLKTAILSNMVNQANFLTDNLEVDLGGNHLLENLHALGLTACFLKSSESERWLDVVQSHLDRELPQQITAHGEHFERSPMYHAFMLETMLNMRDAAATVRPQLGTRCGQVAKDMAMFLASVLHPDGEIPLLGDSVLQQAPPALGLLARAHWSQQTHAGMHQFGGYWSFRDGRDFLLVDAERAMPDFLPAHGHGDLLGLVASVGGQRLFVDSGVCTYAAGEMRSYCRGTAAHNTLEIDGVDQFDMWSRFRIGYRGWPSPLEVGQTGDFSWAMATHNAYRRLGVPTVGRWVACRAGGTWLCIDWAEAIAEHSLVNRLHLHPDVEVQQVDKLGFRLIMGQQELVLQALGAAEAVLEEGWYCAEFGRREENRIVTLRGQFPAQRALGWALCWPGQQGEGLLETQEQGEIAVSWSGPGAMRHVVASKTK